MPRPHDRPLPETHRSGGEPQTFMARLTQSLVQSLLLSPRSCDTRLCALHDSLFPLSCGNSVIKSLCPSKSESLGIPSPFAGT